MLKKLMVMAFLLSSLSAWSYSFFPLNPMMSVFPGRISAQVYNPYYEPIICEGYAYGLTSTGFTYNAFFRDMIPAGQYRFAAVQTNRFNPFVRGWANISCRFL